MIAEIACDIRSLVESTGYVNTYFEYCELIKNGDVTYPAQYDGAGNYVQVFNNDVNGNGYLRKNGNISFGAVSSNVKAFACGGNPFVKMTIPFRLVLVVPKSKLGDNAFSDDLLCQNIINLLSSDVTTSIYGVRALEYSVTSYDSDSLSVWSAEVKGMNYQMNFKFSYVAINFNVISEVNPSCLTESCTPY